MNNLPCAATKKRLYNHFNKLSTKEVRATMNDIIVSVRNISIEEARKVRILRRNEVKKLMIELGELEE